MSFQAGDHLITPRFGYSHHGIYVGNDNVIHYSGLADGLTAGPVEMTTLQAFALGRTVRVRKYDVSKYSGTAAVTRAYDRLGENRYDVHANNCEHFCNWVRTGYHFSRQVEKIETLVGVMGSAAGKFRKERFHGATLKDAATKSGKATIKSLVRSFTVFKPFDESGRSTK